LITQHERDGKSADRSGDLPRLRRHVRDGGGHDLLASIAVRSSFLIGELLLRKLGETVVVHGNAPHIIVRAAS
jgi:hypothetical protein